MKILLYFFLGCVLYIAFPLKMLANCPAKSVSLLYINGSDTNSEETKKNFFTGIKNAHPHLKNTFESDPDFNKNILVNGTLKINATYRTYFWGYNSKNSLKKLFNKLDILKVATPKSSQIVRNFLTSLVHDAIWVQKPHNMKKIIQDLHKEVLAAKQNNEKIILFGYSAGSFVTYEYIYHKLPALSEENISKLLKKNTNGSIDYFLRSHKIHSTCRDALEASKIGVYTETGDFKIITNEDELKKRYLQLNHYTESECIPTNEVLGVVNYGSPVALFYSDIYEPNLEITKYNIYLYKYIKDNNIFFLTVNFSEDPLGFPLGRNLSLKEIEKNYNMEFNKTGRGVIYSKSDIKCPATFLGAHDSYWKYAKKFARGTLEAYIEGYKNFYNN